MSLLENLQSAIDRTGQIVGGVVDGTVQVTTTSFSAVMDAFASVSGFSAKKKNTRGRKNKFTNQLPIALKQEPQVSTFAAEEDQEVKRQREAAFRQAAAEAEKLKWNGGSWEEKRRESWSGQAERNVVGGGPVTYQQAILAQPMPVLSPLRGSNSPQGVRAIVDASVGTTTASFNPALGTPGVAIPSNATAGSLDASIKVNVTNSPAAPAAGVTSSFAAMFD